MENFYQTMRILSTALLMAQGIYYASTQPGSMTYVNAAVHGVAVFTIWFAREKKKA